MTTVLRARNWARRYRRRWALSECALDIPTGRVVGLVGPNGAGKTTLLNLAAGLPGPTAGTIEVLRRAPGAGPQQLAKVGFVAQDTPTYAGLTVADHLRLGARLSPGWDEVLAEPGSSGSDWIPTGGPGSLSGGQRAQLALTLAIAKRPELLILDEPVASLDPLARREFLQDLMEAAAEQELSVMLSSHLVADLERVCDHLSCWSPPGSRRPVTSRTCWPPTSASPGPAVTSPGYPTTSASSPPVTPTGRPRCWSAPTGRSRCPPGRSAGSTSKTSSSPI